MFRIIILSFLYGVDTAPSSHFDDEYLRRLLGRLSKYDAQQLFGSGDFQYKSLTRDRSYKFWNCFYILYNLHVSLYDKLIPGSLDKDSSQNTRYRQSL